MSNRTRKPDEPTPPKSIDKSGSVEPVIGEPDAIGAADPASADAAANEAAIRSSSRQELIRQVAYRRYQERGCTPGDEERDWLEAEAEVDQLRGAD